MERLGWESRAFVESTPGFQPAEKLLRGAHCPPGSSGRGRGLRKTFERRWDLGQKQTQRQGQRRHHGVRALRVMLSRPLFFAPCSR